MDKQDHRKSAREDAKARRKEEMKYYKEQMQRLLNDEAREQLSFPPTLDNKERKNLHNYARKIGLKTKSSGKDDDRFLTVFKKTTKPYIPTRPSNMAYLQLRPDTVESINRFLDGFPVTKAEEEVCINRNHSKNCDLAFGFGGRARPLLTVPPKVESTFDYTVARESLPTYEYRDAIISAIQMNQVIVVSGETGSGKTTQVPQYIMENCTAANEKCRIICTQPRRLAAVSIATRVSEERNDSLGKTVGYQIRLDSRINATTNLIFTTSGYLLSCLTGSTKAQVFKTITHLILDEVHEREKTTDFLMIAIKDAIKMNSHLKVILMSATIDSELFSSYFDNCPVINVPGRLFDVDVKYLDDILFMMSFMSSQMQTFMRDTSQPKMLRTEEKPNEPAEPVAGLSEEEKEFYDACLKECIDGDDETAFDQISYLISDENMPVDYLHSEVGRSALGIAAEKGYEAAVNKLLEFGASPIHRDSSNKTPIDYAKVNGNDCCADIMQKFADAIPTGLNKPMQGTAEDVNEVKMRALKHYTLIAYQMTNNKPQDIDHELLHTLIAFTHKTQPFDGSILVFLPGYEDIMVQKEFFETRIEFGNYQLFVLHSGVNGTNTAEQVRVFDTMPRGIRKIILSTNIAETSITINDVVYVIDAGKVKQNTYDSVGGATCLRSVNISQACAKQRAGRAGRLRTGFCYRLYSLDQYEAMDAYTIPELLRVSLSEICLNARILAPPELSIEAFLMKALQPPAINNIRTSIDYLKKIDALDENEQISQLGMHLVNMPVDCQYGKAILYAVVMRCLQPVITIVSALSVKDPFLLPLGDDAKQIVHIKKGFSQSSLSDHYMLNNTFNQWSRQKGQKLYDFCSENFISHGNMQMIQGINRLIYGYLKSANILPDTVNLAEYNTNKDNWCLVKACLAAGIYPNVCRVNQLTGGISSRQDSKLLPHLSSVLRDRRSKGQLDPIVTASGVEWMIHGEKSSIARYSLIRDITCIPSIVLALFTGSMKLKCSFENLYGDKLNGIADDDMDAAEDDDYDDDDYVDCDDEFEDELSRSIAAMGFGLNANVEMDDDSYETELSIDDWISFAIDSTDAKLLFGLRQKFMAIIVRFLQNPPEFRLESKEWTTIKMITDVLIKEDNVEEALCRVRDRKETADYFRPGTMTYWSEADAASNSIPSTSTNIVNRNGPAYLSQQYTAAITSDKKNKKKNNNKKKGNGKNKQKYARFEDEPSASQTQPNAYMSSETSQPSTSTRKKPKLFTVPKTSSNAPSNGSNPYSGSMFDSQQTLLSAMWNSDEYFNKFYLVAVANVRILKTIWKNRIENWPFIIPASHFQQVASKIGKGVKIILFFYVPCIEKVYGYSELRIKNCHHSFHAAAGPTGGRKWFTELPALQDCNDGELRFDVGDALYRLCIQQNNTTNQDDWPNMNQEEYQNMATKYLRARRAKFMRCNNGRFLKMDYN